MYVSGETHEEILMAGSIGVFSVVAKLPPFITLPAPFLGKYSNWTSFISSNVCAQIDNIRQAGYHTPPLRGTEPGPNSRQALSHRLKKLRVAGYPRYLQDGDSVLS